MSNCWPVLTSQWRRELLTKFGLDFTLVDREAIRQQHSDELLVWREADYALTSVDFARQKALRQVLSSVEWANFIPELFNRTGERG